MLLPVYVVGFVSVYSAMLGSTLDTKFASVYGEFRTFLRVWVDSSPEDDSRLALWTLVPQIPEQIVEVSLLSMRLLDRLMTCPLAFRFLGPCTQVHGRADPRHQGGKGGGGDAGSLLPGVLPPELGASSARAWTDTPCCESSVLKSGITTPVFPGLGSL